MRYVFLNPYSCAGKAPTKWKKIENHFQDARLITNSREFDWTNHTFEKDDLLLSAGGDGTLHHLVNTLIKTKGLDFLKTIGIGHIGLGSNNSFLRPYNECQVISGIPMRSSAEFVEQDLIEIKTENQKKDVDSFFAVANASVGFLAHANQVFNTSTAIHRLKKMSPDLADVATFLKTLSAWNGVELRYETSEGHFQERVTNMHFMKRPFYAADMGFPEKIEPDSGNFNFNLLRDLSRMSLAGRFAKVLLFKDFESGRHLHKKISWMKIESSLEIPFEMDGEVHWGHRFHLQCVPQGVRLCQ